MIMTNQGWRLKMPKGIYLHGKLWCSRCQEKRDPTPTNHCDDCHAKMRTTPRTKAGKIYHKAQLAEREFN